MLTSYKRAIHLEYDTYFHYLVWLLLIQLF